jgi:hypothetical protein
MADQSEENSSTRTTRKVLHYVIATALVLFAFAVQTGCSRCLRRTGRHGRGGGAGGGGGTNCKAWRALDVRLAMSATFALVLCLFKQAGDALSLEWLPWCQLFSSFGYCRFEWLDLFLTVDGILTGLLLLIGVHVCVNRCYSASSVPDLPCDPTVALSVDEGGDREDSSEEGDVLDLTLTEAEDGDINVEDTVVLVEEEYDFPSRRRLAASDDEIPDLNSGTGRGIAMDLELSRRSMFATLSSSPSSSPSSPLIFPSEIITV